MYTKNPKKLRKIIQITERKISGSIRNILTEIQKLTAFLYISNEQVALFKNTIYIDSSKKQSFIYKCNKIST